MAVKTITITETAYNRIKAMKRGDESFSELFMRISPEKLTIHELIGCLKSTPQEAARERARLAQYRKEMNEDFARREALVRSRHQRPD